MAGHDQAHYQKKETYGLYYTEENKKRNKIKCEFLRIFQTFSHIIVLNLILTVRTVNKKLNKKKKKKKKVTLNGGFNGEY